MFLGHEPPKNPSRDARDQDCAGGRFTRGSIQSFYDNSGMLNIVEACPW
jgi:hypothetical protein